MRDFEYGMQYTRRTVIFNVKPLNILFLFIKIWTLRIQLRNTIFIKLEGGGGGIKIFKKIFLLRKKKKKIF